MFWMLIGLTLIVIVAVMYRAQVNSSMSEGMGPPTMDDVHRLINKGNTVSAIKAYRLIHDCDLREAKEAVDQIRTSQFR